MRAGEFPMRWRHVLLATLLTTTFPMALASHQDGCAGGTDLSTGVFDWESAWPLQPPVSCSGVLGVCCSFDDVDWYRVEVPVGTVSSSISVRACADVSTSFGTIDYQLSYQDTLQRERGLSPTVLDAPPQLDDGDCHTSLRVFTGTTAVGGNWYVRLHDALGVGGTTYAYTLEVLVDNQ